MKLGSEKKFVPVRSRCFERSEGSMGPPGPYATPLAESFSTLSLSSTVK